MLGMMVPGRRVAALTAAKLPVYPLILMFSKLHPNAVRTAVLAVDKQTQKLLMPVAARRQPNDLPGELWTKINVELY